MKKVRKYYLSVADINLALAKIHDSIGPYIDKEKYKDASDYVNQFVSYTDIWHMKFVYNLESPEIALLQIFHLIYIFEQEPADKFGKEREILKQQQMEFDSLKPYKDEQIVARKEKMLQYIVEQHSLRQHGKELDA